MSDIEVRLQKIRNDIGNESNQLGAIADDKGVSADARMVTGILTCVVAELRVANEIALERLRPPEPDPQRKPITRRI